MDASRSALRLGADKVTVVYRRTENEMPARREEYEMQLRKELSLCGSLTLLNVLEMIGGVIWWVLFAKRWNLENLMLLAGEDLYQ